MASFAQSFDDLLNGILNDYQGQNPPVDISAASMVFIKSACIASALWGLSKQQDQIATKPFPDQCNLDDLQHWASLKGIPNISLYIDADGGYSRLVAAVLDKMQNPPGAGNKTDWPKWAKECSYDHGDYVEHVVGAWSWEDKRYPGSVDVVITSDRTADQGGEQDPSAELLAAVHINIEENHRSLGVAADFEVLAPQPQFIGVTMSVTDGAVPVTPDLLMAITQDIIDYLKGLDVGATVYIAQLETLAINRGVNVVSFTDPAQNISMMLGPTYYYRAWPDMISVTQAS